MENPNIEQEYHELKRVFRDFQWQRHLRAKITTRVAYEILHAETYGAPIDSKIFEGLVWTSWNPSPIGTRWDRLRNASMECKRWLVADLIIDRIQLDIPNMDHHSRRETLETELWATAYYCTCECTHADLNGYLCGMPLEPLIDDPDDTTYPARYCSEIQEALNECAEDDCGWTWDDDHKWQMP